MEQDPRRKWNADSIDRTEAQLSGAYLELAAAKARRDAIEAMVGRMSPRPLPTARVEGASLPWSHLHSAIVLTAMLAATLGVVNAYLATRAQRDADLTFYLSAFASEQAILAQGRSISADARAAPAEEMAAVAFEDSDVCHKRVSDLRFAMDAMAATIPGRARAPYVPLRRRPPGAPGSRPRQGTAVGQPGAPAGPRAAK